MKSIKTAYEMELPRAAFEIELPNLPVTLKEARRLVQHYETPGDGQVAAELAEISRVRKDYIRRLSAIWISQPLGKRMRSPLRATLYRA